MQAAMTVQLVPDNIFDGVEGLVLGAKHIAGDRDFNRLAALQTVAGEIFTLLRAAAGIDIELGHDMDAAFRNFIACVRRKEEELSGRDLDG